MKKGGYSELLATYNTAHSLVPEQEKSQCILVGFMVLHSVRYTPVYASPILPALF